MLTRRKFLGMMGKVAGVFAALPFLKPVVESIPTVHERWNNTNAPPIDSASLARSARRCQERIAARVFNNDVLDSAEFVRLLDTRLRDVYEGHHADFSQLWKGGG